MSEPGCYSNEGGSPHFQNLYICSFVIKLFNVIRTIVGGGDLRRDAASLFYGPCQLGRVLWRYPHHKNTLTARASLTLFPHQSLSSITPGRSSKAHQVSAQS